MGTTFPTTQKTRNISWNIRSLRPYEKAGVYIELGLTPTAQQTGTSPQMLTNIAITANDPTINHQLRNSLAPLDITIPQDPLGNKKGTQITQ